MKLKALVFFFSFIFVLPSWAAPVVPPVSPAAPVGKGEADVKDQLRQKVIETQVKLGVLEGWQLKIFEEEIIPQYSRFIRDYRQIAGGGLTVDVDVDGLKSYLAFYAPQVLKRPDYKIGVLLVSSEEQCPKCAESAPVIKRLVKARLERRGFVPVWTTPEEQALKAKDKNSTGAVLVRWALASSDEVDSAHAEEKRYQIALQFLARDVSHEFKAQGKLEILENDSIEGAVARLLTDAFSEMGVKALQVINASGQATGGEEYLVTYPNSGDYVLFSLVKTQLEAAIKDVGTVEERKLSRGEITFAVKSVQPLDRIKALLNSLGGLSNGKRMFFNEADARSLKMEIR